MITPIAVRLPSVPDRPSRWTIGPDAPKLLGMAAPDFLAPVDPLTDALRFVRMRGSLYSRCTFRGDWGLALPELPGTLMFHVVTDGACWIALDGEAPRHLGPGDLALVPHGLGHRLLSAPGARATPLERVPRTDVSERYELLRLDGHGAVTGLLCGTLRFGDAAASHLLELLPRCVVVEAAGSRHATWVRHTMHLLADEAADLHPGSESVITRLADVLVVLAIRAWLERDPVARTGWLGALQDPRVSRAIIAMHREPARRWTLAALAREAAMSRSAFAERFAALVGMPPMHYLARWRMHVAQAALLDRDTGLAELASRLGYRSEAAFKRAFKRIVGVAPGSVRRRSRVAVHH